MDFKSLGIKDNDMLGIMFEVHSENIIIYNEFNIEGTKPLFQKEDLIKKCDETYIKFKDLNLSKGTVDYNPLFWANRINELIKKAMNEGKAIVKIPNGCCTQDTCHIKQFYKLYIETIKID